MLRITKVLVLVAVAHVGPLAVAGCGAGTVEGPGAAAPPSRTESSLDAGMQALMVGRLDGDRETQCLWVVPDGSTEPASVVWSEQYQITSDPLGLSDAKTGKLVALAGDAVELTGGSAAADPPIDPDCRVSETVFIAHAVERVAENP